VKDLKEIPEKVLSEIEIEPVEHMDDVLEKALVRKPRSDSSESEEVFFKSDETPSEEVRAH